MAAAHMENGGYAQPQPQQVMVITQPQPQQVVVITQPAPRSNVYPNYPRNASVGLGITQIVLAVLMIIVQSAGISVGANRAALGTVYWNVPCIIIAGAFGIAARNQQSCPIITTMVMSILGTLSALGILANSALGAAEDAEGVYWIPIWFQWHRIVSGEMRAPGFACNIVLVLLSLVTFFIALAQAVICCRHACCGRKTPAATGGIVLSQPGAQPGQAYPGSAPATHQPGPVTFQVKHENGAVAHMPHPVKAPEYAQADRPPEYKQ